MPRRCSGSVAAGESNLKGIVEEKGDRVKHIAICFFGIPRSLRLTYPSIQKNVIEPAKLVGNVSLHAHYFEQTKIDNPRSGEFGELDPDEKHWLTYETLDVDQPGIPPVTNLFEELITFGDSWKDENRSISNLCQQLFSLRKVTQQALASNPDIVAFVRPDLVYHDSLADVFDAAVKDETSRIFTPYWQTGRGLNDRFCVTVGTHAAEQFGFRIDRALEYCKRGPRKIGSERLVAMAMENTPISPISHRASRVRFDGSTREENFDTPLFSKLRRSCKNIPQPGIRSIAQHLLRLTQAILVGRRYTDICAAQLTFGRTKKVTHSLVHNAEDVR